MMSERILSLTRAAKVALAMFESEDYWYIVFHKIKSKLKRIGIQWKQLTIRALSDSKKHNSVGPYMICGNNRQNMLP